jgi:hypothetical protein
LDWFEINHRVKNNFNARQVRTKRLQQTMTLRLPPNASTCHPPARYEVPPMWLDVQIRVKPRTDHSH